MGFEVRDAALKITRALPSAASTTVASSSIDLKQSARADFLQQCEFELSAPAVTTTMAPDTRTFTYNIITSDNADLSAPTVLINSAILQTGAGGAGAAAAKYRFRLPVDVKRYVGVQIVSGASTTTAAAVSATLEPLF